ncbi:MAG: sce7726 family protein [Lachnotalea sp.]
MSNQIVYPTFKDAQQLYTQYSTIENISVLYNNLLETIDSSFLSTMADENIHKIYNKIILNYYPNEICIKSSFIKQVLMSGKKHVTIFELPVGSSRADLCKINGESIAYEIKTDLDNFTRLQKQIIDYYKIFEKVFIICSEANIENIRNLIPEKCGIYSYRQNRQKNYKFTLVRDASLGNEISSLNQIKLIRKSEFNSYFTLDTSFQKRSDITDYIIQTYSPDAINQIFKSILKHRFEKQWSFLKQNHNDILEIDYQWFYKNQIEPSRLYK